MNYNFAKYPRLQAPLRHLAAFGCLDEQSIKELTEAIIELLVENERLKEIEQMYEGLCK